MFKTVHRQAEGGAGTPERPSGDLLLHPVSLLFPAIPCDPAKEILTFFDEYDNRDAYLKALINVGTLPDPAAVRVREQAGDFTQHVVFDDPQSKLQHLVWTELTDLRVQYRFREPLWLGCADG